MDETNPVYENFRNKMRAFGEPIRGTTRRISASKFLGKDDIGTQVAINARKITILKNVIQAQQIQTGAMLTSLSGGSVKGVEENIMDIRKTMASILETLKAQEKFEIEKFRDMQIRLENEKRRGREGFLERLNRSGMNVIKRGVNKVLSPVRNLFSTIIGFFAKLFLGKIMVSFLSFFSNPANVAIVNGIANFIGTFFPVIVAGIVAATVGIAALGIKMLGLANILRAAAIGLGLTSPLSSLVGLGLGGRGVGLGRGIKMPTMKMPKFSGDMLMKRIPKIEKPSIPYGKAGRGFFNFNRGGVVPGSGNSDTVPAMLRPGEVVISKRAAQEFGVGNLLAINAAAGAKSKPIVRNHVIHANEGGVIPAGFPDVGNIFKALVGTAEQLPNSELGKTLSNPEIPETLRAIGESFAMPKSQQRNMGQNIMNTVTNALGNKLDTSKVEGMIKEFPNLTPPNIIQKLNEKGAFEDLNDFIQRFNNPNKIDEKGFENELDEISFFKSPKEKWLTYGAVV